MLKATLKKINTGSRSMRFQTDMGYANSKKWDEICFLEKSREINVICRINGGATL